MAKQERFTLRTTLEFKKRLETAAKKLGLDQSVLATAALEAVVAQVEEHGGIWIPIQFRPSDAPKKSPPGRQAITAPASSSATAVAPLSRSTASPLHGPNEASPRYGSKRKSGSKKSSANSAK